ncbi:MAG: hypothetical protein A2552_02395 [Sulfuricurvum sp. RIFOXYD2_FULL_44_160]|uniref:HTH domain-containing protein n=1 Tax=unclassified Sulfuricurvum TaxID=2632390 RepID=UPI0008B53676|nr:MULTISPECIES: HTH domain-containing protein [unclassified Sulfuricurvum]OHD92896.1 MAG: hypothetical protein A2552_02395 [Sulfuricurvum sp. RIFOXYD2_FULL_44_160]OHD96154.1 MAG: hypothetical protein A2517_05210 [Sulfuricurvum sp. RIFOXYD12_FULL_44_77]
MTIKDAILQALENFNKPVTSNEVSKFIQTHNLYEFSGLTPDATISALLGDFIRKNDSRVGRSKQGRTHYLYYLTKNKNDDTLISYAEPVTNNDVKKVKVDFQERDLHKLFVSYLKSKDIYSKTIFHEESKNSKDDHQKWIHPDIIGVKFVHLKNDTSIKLLKTLEKKDSCEFISYELKKEIRSDYDLKKSYFQAVSNSSWANSGYLVAFEIDTKIYNEMERLNKAFGIGVIKLQSNPFESQIIFPSSYRELDYQTIDKLCHINNDYRKFIDQVEKILNADDRYLSSSEQELEKLCDICLEHDSDIEEYCVLKNIPYDKVINIS